MKKESLRLKLVLPSKKYLKSWQNFIADFIKTLPESDPDKKAYEKHLLSTKKPQYLKWLRDDSKGVNLEKGMVQQTTCWGVVGDVVVGRISFRHKLTKKLREEGGHIGYAVRPKYQKKGYATQMLRQLLMRLKKQQAEIGLKKVLLTCDFDNVGSYKTIESQGGKLAKEGFVNGVKKRWYWVAL